MFHFLKKKKKKSEHWIQCPPHVKLIHLAVLSKNSEQKLGGREVGSFIKLSNRKKVLNLWTWNLISVQNKPKKKEKETHET